MTAKARTILVSGATGAVGRALCRRLSLDGHRLAIAVRRSHQVRQVAAELGPAHLIAEVGSSDSEAAAGLVKGATDLLGPPDVLISVSGRFLAAPAGGESNFDVDRVFAANVLGPITLTRAVLPGMRQRRCGTIVFCGAAAVHQPPPGMSLYIAAKGALHAYAAALQAELQPAGVAVRLVAPYTVDTEANREAMPDADHKQWMSIERLVDLLCREALCSDQEP